MEPDECREMLRAILAAQVMTLTAIVLLGLKVYRAVWAPKRDGKAAGATKPTDQGPA